MARESKGITLPIIYKANLDGLKQAEGALSGFGKKLLSVGALVAGAFAIRGIVNFGMESVIAAERAQQFNDILVQVAKTTNTFGGNLTAGTDRLLKFADAQELVIGVEAELIKETQAVLLSFKSVGQSADEAGGSFDRATMAAFDIAGVLKTDARSAAVQLGKALENPIRGLTALGKAGTTFTDQQKEQIRVLVESGNLLGAQTLILDEIESQYGGVAEAAALGSVKIKLAFGQIQDALGAALAPAFEKFTTYFITDVVPPLTKFFEDDFPRIIAELKPIAEDVMSFFSDIGQGLKDFLEIDADTSLLVGILDKFREIGANPDFEAFLGNVRTIFTTMAPALASVVGNIATLAANLTPLLEDALGRVIPLLRDTVGIFSSINYFLGEIIKSFGFFEDETPDFIKAIDNQLNPIGRLQTALRGLNDFLRTAISLYERFRALGGQTPSELATGGRRFDLGARANGGRVTGGMPYLVGEMGPEIFQPSRGGNIVPNDRLGSGGGVNITINVTAGMGTNGAQVGEQIVNAIKRYERASGPVFASA
jgi:hypothetical protein